VLKTDVARIPGRLRQPTWEAVARRVLARPALAIYCLALVVRLVYNLTAARAYQPSYDAALYNFIARNLITRHCYCIFGTQPTVSRAPLWPWIMAAIYAIFGQNDLYARLFYCLLGSGTCVIVYWFARDLFGRRTGLLAGLMAAVYVGLFLYDGWLYTESLYTFLATAATYALYRLQTAGPVRPAADPAATLTPWQRIQRTFARHRWELLCGLLIGAATLTRPNGLALLGVVAVWAAVVVWTRRWPWRQALSSFALITLLALALVAPWTARNYAVTGTFIPVETGMGEVLLGSYNDAVAFGPWDIRGLWRPPPGALNHDNIVYTPAMDRQDTARALSWMLAHPGGVLSLWAWHFEHMWSPYSYMAGLPIQEYPDRFSANVVWALIFAETIPVFLLAALGLYATRRHWRLALLPVYLVLGVTVIENVLLYSTMRFRAPIEPLLVLLAAAGLAALARYARTLGWPTRIRFALPASSHP
jgi:hypothetical protein